jgi:hypothetical protein
LGTQRNFVGCDEELSRCLFRFNVELRTVRSLDWTHNFNLFSLSGEQAVYYIIFVGMHDYWRVSFSRYNFMVQGENQDIHVLRKQKTKVSLSSCAHFCY